MFKYLRSSSYHNFCINENITNQNLQYTVKPRFIAPRFTAKLAYRQEFLVLFSICSNNPVKMPNLHTAIHDGN